MPQKSIGSQLLIALGGATGSGKTALAIALAKKHRELVILSCDSRQIYKKLDIGTAKIGSPSTDSSLTSHPEPVWVEDGVPQFLIDIAQPNTDFTLTQFQNEAYRLIEACWEQGKIPFLVGGTGLYIQSIVEGFTPPVKPNANLRRELETLSIHHLQNHANLLSISLNHSDWHNPRRLIRAIERQGQPTQNQPITDNAHVFVIYRPWPEQSDLASAMVKERLDLGLIPETKKLLNSGVNNTWLKNTGLSYRLVIRMLDGDFPESELPNNMVKEFRQLMKRQLTWFKRMPYTIHGDSAQIKSKIEALL